MRFLDLKRRDTLLDLLGKQARQAELWCERGYCIGMGAMKARQAVLDILRELARLNRVGEASGSFFAPPNLRAGVKAALCTYPETVSYLNRADHRLALAMTDQAFLDQMEERRR